MSLILKQAFGKSVAEGLDLYQDVLKVEKSCTLAQLRKAYYQQALQYHPDKNSTDDNAKVKFQAISWVYQFLKDPEKRADYDAEGIVPHEDDFDDDDNDDNDNNEGRKSWKNYFDLIFGKVTTSDIDAFAAKYKMSEEEEQDVLKYWSEKKGNVMKMLDFVMLSELRDVARWVEDYIQPALVAKKIPSYPETLARTLKQVQKKLDQQQEEEQEEDEQDEDEDEDDEEVADADQDDDTETEESDEKFMDMEDDDDDDEEQPKTNGTKKTTNTAAKKVAPKKATAGKTTKPKPKPKPQTKTTQKGGATKATKKKQETSSQSDLIAAIRNKNRSNPFSALGARYGVNMDDNDPLDDAQFAKLQSKVNSNKKNRKK